MTNRGTRGEAQSYGSLLKLLVLVSIVVEVLLLLMGMANFPVGGGDEPTPFSTRLFFYSGWIPAVLTSILKSKSARVVAAMLLIAYLLAMFSLRVLQVG